MLFLVFYDLEQFTKRCQDSRISDLQQTFGLKLSPSLPFPLFPLSAPLTYCLVYTDSMMCWDVYVAPMMPEPFSASCVVGWLKRCTSYPAATTNRRPPNGLHLFVYIYSLFHCTRASCSISFSPFVVNFPLYSLSLSLSLSFSLC